MMISPAIIVLLVSPSLNVDSRKAYSTRGQLFDAKIDGRFVVRRSTTPFCDAARALLAEGVDPATKLVMRHSALNPFGIGAPSVSVPFFGSAPFVHFAKLTPKAILYADASPWDGRRGALRRTDYRAPTATDVLHVPRRP
jgi:hypothetical protein